MSNPAPLLNHKEDQAEAASIAAAIAGSDADPRTAPHHEVRAWLSRLAASSYILIYRVIEPDAVTILRVWHAAQSRAAHE